MSTHSSPPRSEDPVLALTEVGICLHYVEICDDGGQRHAYPHGSVMESMELDLLAYRFQDPPPFGSRTEGVPAAPQLQRRPHGRWPIVIEFPEAFVYHSEGRAPQLACAQPRREAEILVSSTRFLTCGLRIWHLVVTPRPGGTFSEFDLIKLIHLYDGRTERTGLRESIRFRLGDAGADSITAADLPRLLGLPLESGTLPELKCGTLEMLIGPQNGGDADNPYVTVFDTLRSARESDGAAAGRQLKTWMQQDCVERRIIMAYCGIVTGIFDFDRIDDEEALDTLEPTFPGSSAFLRIHRRSLIAIADDDRSMRECWNSVGISPYLILPHAALLYNETLVDMAERTLDAALSDADARLDALETAHIEADRRLNTLYLPNVFNYVTERSLFEAGGECRGSEAKRSAVLAKLDQLKGHIDIVRERERNRGQIVIQLLLAVISLLQIKGVIAEIFGWQEQNPGVWLALTAGIVILAGVVWWSYHKGLPRRIVNRAAGRS
jgi:hypothetical protein